MPVPATSYYQDTSVTGTEFPTHEAILGQSSAHSLATGPWHRLMTEKRVSIVEVRETTLSDRSLLRKCTQPG